jgi:ABC-type transporter Mla subunit MlaD
MTEATFRLVITAGVAIACLAFLVQAALVFALYRLTRIMQVKASGFMDATAPVVQQLEPLLERAGPVIDRIGPALDAVQETAEKLGPGIERIGPVADKIASVAERAAALVQSANLATTTASRIMQDSRPKIAEFTEEAAALTRASREQVERAGEVMQGVRELTANVDGMVSELRPKVEDVAEQAVAVVTLGREQVQRAGELLQDAGDRTRARLEQIDQAVDSTVGQIENVGGAMKTAVMKPVREVNGIAAGISAAVSTLVRGPKGNVSTATQDEEMFI